MMAAAYLHAVICAYWVSFGYAARMHMRGKPVYNDLHEDESRTIFSDQLNAILKQRHMKERGAASSPLRAILLYLLAFNRPARLGHTFSVSNFNRHMSTPVKLWHSALPAMPRAQVDLGKKDFVPYVISGESTPMFPLPKHRDAVGVAKKLVSKGGAKASKLTAGDGLHESQPGLNLSFPGLKILHLDPPVITVDNFFTDAECDEYLALHSGDSSSVYQLEQSATFSGLTAQARTSTTWFVAYQRVPYLLARAAALLGVEDIARFEEPQLVRYQPGQYFNWHYDEVPSSSLFNGGQRVATLLVYLNDVPAGGRTTFRDLRAGGIDANGQPLQLQVAPKKGRAILFFPASQDGTPDERTLHAGESTRDGEIKWIAQLWLHEKPYKPTAPEGSSQDEALPAVHTFAKEHGLQLATGSGVG